MIELKSVSKHFSEREALRKVNLHVEKNELLAVVGPSGCGKTTTLNIIAGLCNPDEGEVFIDKVLVDGKIGRRKVHLTPSKREVGYVFQNYALFPHMRVRDNISYGLKAMHLPKDEIKERTQYFLEFIGLHGYSESYPHELSGGQKQRVALARSLVTNPQVLLLDEPLSAVDPRNRESLRTDFKNLFEALEVTTIYVTHDLAEACTLSDKIAVMENGRMEQIGQCDQILEKPNSRFVAEFLGLNVYDGRVIHNSSGMVMIKIGNTEVQGPAAANPNDETVLVSLKPEDVILSTDSTIKNHKWCGCTCNNLSGTVVEIIRMKSNAKVIVDVGFPVRSELTLSSLKDLELEEGKKAYVQFKAEALQVASIN